MYTRTSTGLTEASDSGALQSLQSLQSMTFPILVSSSACDAIKPIRMAVSWIARISFLLVSPARRPAGPRTPVWPLSHSLLTDFLFFYFILFFKKSTIRRWDSEEVGSILQ
jgi:hypothetical protein